MPTLVISGPSGCGKSTLADTLSVCMRAEGYSITVIHQDSYFLGPKPTSYWTQPNKEHPGVVDMSGLRAAVADAHRSTSSSASLVLVEGFLLLQDAEIMAMVDGVLFLHASLEVCVARRLARSPRTPHESEGLLRYYHQCVWPGYQSQTVSEIVRLRTSLGEGRCSALVELDAGAGVDAVAQQAVGALPSLVPGDARASMARAASSAAAARSPALCALLEAGEWPRLAAEMRGAIAAMHGAPEKRRSVGLSLASPAARALAKAAGTAAAPLDSAALDALGALCRALQRACAGDHPHGGAVRRSVADGALLRALTRLVAGLALRSPAELPRVVAPVMSRPAAPGVGRRAGKAGRRKPERAKSAVVDFASAAAELAATIS